MKRIAKMLFAVGCALMFGACASKDAAPASNALPGRPAALPRRAPESTTRWRGVALSDSRATLEEIRPSATVNAALEAAVAQAWKEEGNGKVAQDEVWATVIDCRDPRDPRMGAVRGDTPVYPASVVKLCYMVAAFDQNRTRGLAMDDEMRFDLGKMIGESNNKATNRILDKLSNTGFGPALDGEAADSFARKRGTVSRTMHQLGLESLWAANKTFDDEIPLYGRDPQFLGTKTGDNYERSNKMTTNDTARLLYLIWRRAVVDPPACDAMLQLMKRDKENGTFFHEIAPPGATVYSKDGNTNLARHDAAIFEYPDGGSIIVVVFSFNRNVQDEKYPRVIQRTAQSALEKLGAMPGEMDNATRDSVPGASLKK